MKSVNKAIYQSNFLEKRILLNKKKAKYWINELTYWLFCSNKEYIEYDFFEQKEVELKTVLKELLEQEEFSNEESTQLTEDFFSTISEVYKKLLQDLKTILAFDPAAKSRNEVLIAYPGFFAITVHRVAYVLWKKNVFILSRFIAEYAHSKTGIDIHPAATIGESFFIDHGTGIVIGETAVIGKNVKIYQGVTLGALTVSKDKASEKRHPTIEDDVVIYANATILGGNTTIGKGAVIGGNVWITNSIPAQSLVFHKSEIIIKNIQNFPEAINFSI
ncbi:serine O-acetyltransferase EpsC [Flavobacterium sp.]|uniref:serine O-acetyltransferase EpsC n=1 Tax=Flavobacterium sp. TaxID=239 RepID=UPI00286D5F24|nr:serine O-acetyltransferase EpsC [Flavobacterium sp.]